MPAITEETKYDRFALQQIKKTQNGISKNRMRFRNGHSPKTNSSDELSNILKSIDSREIPKDYADLIKQNLDKNLANKVKFDNDILHRSKVIKHFLDENAKLSRTEKDLEFLFYLG